MKVAVISDIHGFSIALDRVLADIDVVGVDRIIAAGDLCEGGPDPAGVLDRLQDRGIEAVQGNTDRDLAAESRTSKPARWVIQQLGPDGLATLRDLPFELRITPPGGHSPKDDLLVVHANPVDQDRALDPEASKREIEEILGDVEAAILAFAHIHISYIREVNGLTLVDVSAVGNPKDGRLVSRWGLFTWDEQEGRWLAEIRYVDYPLDETEAQVRESGMPNPDKVLAKLKRASY
ncbi:MAG: metallophosphoesterase family protein [Thermomicrobiales bacterium]